MNLLHLDSSILGANSVSRKLSAEIVAVLKASDPDLAETYRDLAASPLPHLSGGYLAAAQSPGGDHAPELREDLAMSDTVLSEFLAADIVVIGVAFYNLTIPSQLKAWIDRIVVAKKTFHYNAEGQLEGLAGDKRVILAIARGGFYRAGTRSEAAEHAETYLRAMLGFIGITNPQIVVAEGLYAGHAAREEAMADAAVRIAALAA